MAMAHIFDLFPGIELTWLKRHTKVLGCVNILGDSDDQRGEVDAKLIFCFLFDDTVSDHSVVCLFLYVR